MKRSLFILSLFIILISLPSYQIKIQAVSMSNPSGIGKAIPAPIIQGGNTLLTLEVTPGINPPSTGMEVFADLSSVSGSRSTRLFDDRINGDEVANDGIYSAIASVPTSVLPGVYSLPVNITDAQGRRSQSMIELEIQNTPANCSTERLAVKTGSFATASRINLSDLVPTTIAVIRSWREVVFITANSRAVPYESTVFALNATLKKYRRDNDSNYQLVLEDEQGRNLTLKSVCPCCVIAQSPFLESIINVRNQLDARLTATENFQDTNIPVRITGLGFIASLTGIEIQPILSLTFEVDLQKPYIVSASVKGRKLFVKGLNFAQGAVILMDGEEQKTVIDDENPSTVLIGKKAGKFIAPEQMVTLQVKLANGTLSDGLSFTKQ
jgi:hypothetical protein